MKNFNKKGAFSKGGDFGGRPKFGGDRKFAPKPGDDRERGGDRGGFGGGRPELFSAVCSNCGKSCELPFRPSGDRPVFCRDCFDKKDDTRGHSTFQRTERPREFRTAPREGSNNQENAEIKKQLANLEYKMDRILKILSVKENPAIETVVKAEVDVAKKVNAPKKKAVAKKEKPAPAKKAAKKKA